MIAQTVDTVPLAPAAARAAPPVKCDTLRRALLLLPRENHLELDDHLKKLMGNLGVAINDALSDSSEISDAIEAVRAAGYDVFLVLEATIGLNRRREGQEARGDAEHFGADEVQLKMSPQDMKFLKSLKIRVDEQD